MFRFARNDGDGLGADWTHSGEGNLREGPTLRSGQAALRAREQGVVAWNGFPAR